MAAWKHGVVDISVNTTTVASGSVDVRGYYVNTVLSAHPCNIKDGANTVFIVPASSPAGTMVEFSTDDGVTFETNLIVDPDDSGTGNITILYRERVQ